jgi:hypothetical protein
MYQSFYLGVNPEKVDYHWNQPASVLKEELIQILPKTQGPNWAMPYLRTYKYALEPQIKFLQKKYGETISLHEITALLSKEVVFSGSDLQYKTSTTKSIIEQLIRVQSIYRGLLLIAHEEIFNYPITHFVGDDYFCNYLKHRAKIHNFLRYDPRIRKNIIEFMVPPEIKNINRNIWENFNLEYLFHCPVLLEAKIWHEKWEKLNEIPDFWKNFKIKNDPQNRDEFLDISGSINLARDKKQRKYKKVHKYDLLQQFLEHAWPKYPDVESPEFLEIAKPHLQAIGEIAAYAEQNNLWFVKFYI